MFSKLLQNVGGDPKTTQPKIVISKNCENYGKKKEEKNIAISM